MKKLRKKGKYTISLILILSLLIQISIPSFTSLSYADTGTDEVIQSIEEVSLGDETVVDSVYATPIILGFEPFSGGIDLGKIFKDVALTIHQSDSDPGVEIKDGDIIDIQKDTVVKLNLKWEIADNIPLKAGDYAEITIPKALEGIAEAMTGKLLWGSLEVAQFTITGDTLKVVFNNELADKDERKGEAWVWLKFDLVEFNKDVVQKIDFEAPIDKAFTVIAKPGGSAAPISKSGAPNEKLNAEYISWVVDVNTSMNKLTNAIVEDTIPAGLTFKAGSLEVYDLKVGLNGTVTELGKSSKTAIDFPVTLGETSSAYRIKYQTAITDWDKATYDNVATLYDGTTKKADANFDIGKLTTGSKIEKSGVANNGGKNSDKITWTINVNKSELPLNNVEIEEDLTALSPGLTIDNSSIKIYELNKSGSNWDQGSDVTSTYNGTSGFPIILGNLEKKAYRIVFDTNINYGTYNPSNTFDNKAVLYVNSSKAGEAPASVKVDRESLLEKAGKEKTSYGVPYIEWTIYVNKANHPITNARITDRIAAGLKLRPDSIKFYEGNSTTSLTERSISSTYPYTDSETDNGFKAYLGDINKYYRIVYETEIISSTAILRNDVDLWGDGLSGIGVGGGTISKDYTVLNKVENSYAKTAADATKSGVDYKKVDHTNKTMSWMLTVDAVKEEVTSLTITDTFEPAGSMVFIADSLKVQKDGVTVVDAVYSLTDNGTGGFVLTLNPLDRAKYEIYYKTSFDPDVVQDAGGILNINNSYKNIARFEGTTKKMDNSTGTIDTSKDATQSINSTVWNGGKKDVSLDREGRRIKWNIYVNALGQALEGQDFVITDILSSSDPLKTGQEYDKGSLIVKEYSLDKSGVMTPGKVVPATNYEVDWNPDGKQFTLTFKNGITEPYMVEFYTDIVGVSKQEYKNDANITGRNLTKNYNNKVSYPNWNSFLIKDTPGVTNVYTDDEVKWKLTINQSLSDIESGAMLTDTLSNGLIYVNDSLVIKDKSGVVLQEGAGKDYNFSLSADKKTLTIIFLKNVKVMYTVEYSTVVDANAGTGIKNNAKFNGQTSETTQIKDKQFTVKQFAGGTGSGVDRSGKINIVKQDGDDNATKLVAGFKLYYMLNGEPYYVKNAAGGDIHKTESTGKLEFAGLMMKKYYLKEVEVPTGYKLLNEPIEFELTSVAKTLSKVINNFKPKSDITAIKVWNGGKSARPDIELQLYRNGAALGIPATLSSGTTAYTWPSLPELDASGNKYTYTVKEVNVPENYTKAEDGLMVTNTYVSPKTKVTGHKSWIGGPAAKPDIQLQLYRNSSALGSPITLKNGTTSYTWEDLDKTDSNGADYVYTIDEVNVPENYGKSISDDELTITNTYGSPKIDIVGKKVWVNGFATRPTIELQLYRNGIVFGAPVELSNGTISYNWKDLDKTDANGVDYVYTVDEVNVPENYGKSVDGLTVTNTYVIPKTEITGKKVWVGGSSEKPSIELQLYKDGKAIGAPVKLDNGKTEYTWTDLDKTDENGIVHKYTIDEVQVPRDYEKSISNDGRIITNRYAPPNSGGGGTRPPVNPPVTPPVVPPVTPPVNPPVTPPVIPPVAPPETIQPPTEPEPTKPIEETTEKEKPVGGKTEIPEGSIPSIGTEPKNGTVIIDKDGNWKYTPNPGFVGKDSFTIKVKDKDGNEKEVLVEIDVEEIPFGTPKALPKTGESDKIPFYLAGMLFILAGVFIRKRIA